MGCKKSYDAELANRNDMKRKIIKMIPFILLAIIVFLKLLQGAWLEKYYVWIIIALCVVSLLSFVFTKQKTPASKKMFGVAVIVATAIMAFQFFGSR